MRSPNHSIYIFSSIYGKNTYRDCVCTSYKQFCINLKRLVIPNPNEVKWEISLRKNQPVYTHVSPKTLHSWKLKHHLINKHGSKKKSQRILENMLSWNKMKYMEWRLSDTLMKIYSSKCIYQRRGATNQLPMFPPKKLEKEE